MEIEKMRRKADRDVIMYLAIILIGLLFILPIVTANSITITAPPWDYCGLHHTHAGLAFDCIAFDVSVIVIK